MNFAQIFADNALYLQKSKLIVRGSANPLSHITLSLIKEKTNEMLLSASGNADENGVFAIEIITPEASFDKYTIKAEADGECASFGGILFGELWLASGQSNMELPNRMCNEWDEMRESIKDMPIRVYNINNRASDDQYPRYPLPDFPGHWAEGEYKDIWNNVSATATSFAKELYLYFLGQGKEIPVGFINVSRGGSNIECWIPEEDALKNKAVVKHLKKALLYPSEEKYNKLGAANYFQLGCHYNFKIHPLLGLKCRGIIWYQGETNIGSHSKYGAYSDLLKQVRDSYFERFAPDSDAPFPLIASHLYPWAFASCSMGYLNTSITYLAKKYPKKFSYLPVCDMKSGWCFQIDNHPIHPTHKYEHGKRYFMLAANAVYGRGGRVSQKTPAILKSWRIDGSRILLEFSSTGSGIYVKGSEARGIYIRSENSVYTKANAEVIDKNTLAVSHPYIDKPIHVCYAMSSFEHYCNLFAGEFPIGPFSTEADMKKGTPSIDVKVKNWLYNELDGEVFILEQDKNVFPRAIFHPSDNSEVSFDSDYALTSRSIRVRGCEKGFGCFVLAHKLRELDLQNYKALNLSVLNSKALELTVKLHYSESIAKESGDSIESIIHKQGSIANAASNSSASQKSSVSILDTVDSGTVYEIKAEKLKEYSSGWGDFTVSFDNIPKGEIRKMEFSFVIGEENHLRTTAAIDKLILIPKQ